MKKGEIQIGHTYTNGCWKRTVVGFSMHRGVNAQGDLFERPIVEFIEEDIPDQLHGWTTLAHFAYKWVKEDLGGGRLFRLMPL